MLFSRSRVAAGEPSEGVTENVETRRADVVATIGDALGPERGPVLTCKG